MEDEIKKMIVEAKQFNVGKFKVSVQPRDGVKYRVYVQREDTQQSPDRGERRGPFDQQKGAGVTVYLDEGRNDVLNAVNLAGGPPGSMRK